MGTAQHHFTDFYNFLQKETEDGYDLEGKPRPYIRREALKRYWEIWRIKELLNSALLEASLNISSQVIREYYLIPLSVLTLLSSSDKSFLFDILTFINAEITDYNCPLRKNNKLRHELWPLFYERQWQFCPIKLGFHNCFDADHDSRSIFPGWPQHALAFGAHDATTLFGPGEAKIHSMKVAASEANELLGLNESIDVIIKSYPSIAYQWYQSERQAYTSLQSDLKDGKFILKCQGSFFYRSHLSRNMVYNLVLEQANGGSLKDFYERVNPPKTHQEIRQFWASLINFLYGLGIVHNDGGINPTRGMWFHQDLKPSNILIFKESNGPFDFTPKLSGFGHSAITMEGAAWYHDGTSTYSPPEARHSEYVQLEVKPEYDRWAAGCILVDAAVWVKEGVDGQLFFAQARRNENKRKAQQYTSLGGSDRFHDNNELLECVKQVEHTMRQQQHDLSASIVGAALSDILGKKKPHKRMASLPFHSSLELLISRAEMDARDLQTTNTHYTNPDTDKSSTINSQQINVGSLSTDPSGSIPRLLARRSWSGISGQNPFGLSTSQARNTPGRDLETSMSNQLSYNQISQDDSCIEFYGTKSPVAPRPHDLESVQEHQHLPRLIIPPKAKSTGFPVVKIQEVEIWRLSKKQGKPYQLQGMKEAVPVLQRDHIFVIDDSRSMKNHKVDLISWFRNLAYLLKTVDDGGVEVVLTSSEEKRRERKTRDLENYVRANLKFSGSCNMEWCLVNLFNELITNLPDLSIPKRTGIFGLGRQKDPKPISIYILTDGLWTMDLKHEIQRLVDIIKRRSLPRTQVALQFVRFGNDPVAIERLDFLDGFLDIEEDIIDHKSTDDGIWQILIGCLDQENDAHSGGREIDEAFSAHNLDRNIPRHLIGLPQTSQRATSGKGVNIKDSAPLNLRQLAKNRWSDTQWGTQNPAEANYGLIEQDHYQKLTKFDIGQRRNIKDYNQEDYPFHESQFQGLGQADPAGTVAGGDNDNGHSTNSIFWLNDSAIKYDGLSDKSSAMIERESEGAFESDDGYAATCREREEHHVPNAFSSWTFVWYRVLKLFQPPTAGFQRIFYVCPMYLDVKELRAGGLRRFQERLHTAAASKSQQNFSESTPDRALGTECLKPGRSGISLEAFQRQYRAQRRLSGASQSQHSKSTSLTPDTTEPQYLLLCINIKSMQTLEHLEVGSLTSDHYLFQQIFDAYRSTREEHTWNFLMLFPFWLRRLAYTTVKELKARKLLPESNNLLTILHYAFSSLDLHKVSTGDYVRFQLVPIGEQCCPQWFKSPELPPKSELVAGRYIYEPGPMEDVELRDIPLDHLLKPGLVHEDTFWIETFPKKLSEQLRRPPGTKGRVIGWGIRINERLNWAVVLFGLLLILIGIGIIVMIYSSVTSDDSSAFGLGAFLAAVLTVYLTYQYFCWKEDT